MATYLTTVKITKNEAKSGCTKMAVFQQAGRQYQVNIPSGTKSGQVISFYDVMAGDDLRVTVKVKTNAFAVIAGIIAVCVIIGLIASRDEEYEPSKTNSGSTPAVVTPKDKDSTVYTDETYSPKKQDYYNQLNSLDKRLYAAAYNAASAYEDKFTVKMSSSEYEYFCDNEMQFMRAVELDHPELMLIGGGWTSEHTRKNGTYTVTVSMNMYSWFASKSENMTKCGKAYKTAESIAASIMADSSYEYLRVLAAHDYIVSNTHYDKYRQNIFKTQDGAGDSGTIYSAYGLLVNGRAVCEGYAKTMKLLLDIMDIPCIYVSTGTHGFNIAWIDGEPTYIDACWDDNTKVLEDGTLDIEDLAVEHEYFGMTTAEIEHIDSHHVSESQFVLPLCTSFGLRYHRFMGEYTQFYDFETVKNIVTMQSDWGLSTYEVLFGSKQAMDAALDDLYGDNKMIWQIPCIKGHRISHSSNEDTFVIYINILE